MQLCRGVAVCLTACLAISPSLIESAASDEAPSLHQAPVAQSSVIRYLLTPQGTVEGVLLEDGAEVYINPTSVEEVAKVLQPGDRVRIHGIRHKNSLVVRPDLIINETKHTRHLAPFARDLSAGSSEPPEPAQEMTVRGTVKVLVYNPATEKTGGILLSDGTQVHFPPDLSDAFRESIRIGDVVTVQGNGLQTPNGKVLTPIAMGERNGPLTFLTPSSSPLH